MQNDSRTRLLDLSCARVEDMVHARASCDFGPEGYSPEFQVCLPYRGIFLWQVGGEDVVGDPNQVIFVRAGETFRMRGPHPAGYAELIVTPTLEALAEVAQVAGQRLSDHLCFTLRSMRAEPSLQRFRAQFHFWAMQAARMNDLELEELVFALLRLTFRQAGRRESHGRRTSGLIRRAKMFLEAHQSERILLADIARAAGASPAYLTDLFTRSEGVSLHQYLLQLRLARALVELPHANDLTSLALDLGFSSHSHFTFAFRRVFGYTPAQFRERSRRHPPLPPLEANRPTAV